VTAHLVTETYRDIHAYADEAEELRDAALDGRALLLS
jgi:hypothetical protein